jgi:hypothetical protein
MNVINASGRQIATFSLTSNDESQSDIIANKIPPASRVAHDRGFEGNEIFGTFKSYFK